jgi:hypothetical protein
MIEYLEQPYEVIEKPLPWQRQGLQETASGYGAKLTSSRMIRLPDGRTRRIYITRYGNIGSLWITLNGKKLFIGEW